MPKKTTASHQEPVTLVFNWKVKKGKEKEFEKWAHLTTKASEKFEGQMGAIWIRPGSNNQNYTLLYKFDTYDHYKAWNTSDVRKKLVAKALEMTDQEKPKIIQEITGLETWFTLPNTMTIKPPPKWKMWITTIIGVFPVLFIVQLTIVPLTEQLPVLPRSVILALTLPTILTFIVMPNLTKLFSHWLYPRK